MYNMTRRLVALAAFALMTPALAAEDGGFAWAELATLKGRLVGDFSITGTDIKQGLVLYLDAPIEITGFANGVGHDRMVATNIKRVLSRSAAKLDSSAGQVVALRSPPRGAQRRATHGGHARRGRHPRGWQPDGIGRPPPHPLRRRASDRPAPCAYFDKLSILRLLAIARKASVRAALSSAAK
jgi:hypothetical protein